MTLRHLDRQLDSVRFATEAPDLPDPAWEGLATTVHDEIAGLDEAVRNQLRMSMHIPPERYVEELTAFQCWMEIAHANETNPVIVRAQVMTELYVAFVWLRDSVMKPTAAALSEQTTFVTIERFLSSGRRRTFRNAIAHGRWCYLSDFSGLEYWAEPSRGQQHQRLEISNVDLEAWQLLSRGTAIAALIALTGGWSWSAGRRALGTTTAFPPPPPRSSSASTETPRTSLANRI